MEKYEKITETIRNAKDAVDVEIATEPQMRKKGNPYVGRVRKHTAYIGVDFGGNYTDEVNRRREEEGKETDFQARKSVYERVNEYIVRKGEQHYLQMLLKKENKTKSFYEVDGRPATEAEAKEIEGFFYARKKSDNQGLEEGNEVAVRVVKVENIVAIGGETWTREL